MSRSALLARGCPLLALCFIWGGCSSPTTPGASSICTQVIGFSQTQEWFLAGGAFESRTGNEQWQLQWRTGASIDLWADPAFVGWDAPIVSPCAERSATPDRVLLTISGQLDDDPARWLDAILSAVAVLERKLPGVRRIVLQPVIGGPDNASCPFGNEVVRASANHPVIDEAILMAVGGKITAGASPEVMVCSEFRDSIGHLMTIASERVGTELGEFYSRF